jgi:hypothetical protein
VLLGQCLEGVGQRAQPRRVRALGKAVVIGRDSLDVAALAIGLGADCARLSNRVLRFLGPLGRGAVSVRVPNRIGSDAPAGNRTARIVYQHVAEGLVGLAPPERMQQCHRALQFRLDRLAAGIRERDGPELFARLR